MSKTFGMPIAAAVLSGMLFGCAGVDADTAAQEARGAAFTTFVTPGVCMPGSQNGINCNHYRCSTDVYINGGPIPSGLRQGTYFFEVVAPGCQNRVNTGGACTLSEGSIADRTFTVNSAGMISSHSPTQPEGFTPNGQLAIGIAPFRDTPNPGGVFILAICPIVNGVPQTSPSQCKYDAFKTNICEVPPDAGKKDHEEVDAEKKDDEAPL